MSEGEPKCTHVCDCAALHEIATTTSGNLKAILLAQLEAGVLNHAAEKGIELVCGFDFVHKRKLLAFSFFC
jgi:hypothetical protein